MDVLIIGGGIIGASIAFRLAQARLKVTVVDRAEPGSEASTAAAGMLAPQGEMVKPKEFSDFCFASRDLYPRFVAEIEELSGEQVGYRRDGSLLVALNEHQESELRELHHAQTRQGLPAEAWESAEVQRRIPGLAPDLRWGLFVPGDHRVDNERLMRALVKSCKRLGVQFETGQAVAKFNLREGHVESVETASAERGTTAKFSTGSYILSAGCWSGELAAPLGLKLPLRPCRGHMLELDAPAELPLVVRAGLHYLVPRAERRVLAGTTAEYAGFDKAVTAEGLRSVLEGAIRLAPRVKDFRFRRAWAGFRPDTTDHLPILGHGAIENLILATGHFRNGILLAPVTAQVISELLLTGTTSHSLNLYSPARFA
jgi:glycine oxidase